MKRRTFVKTTGAVTAGAVFAPYISKGKSIINVVPNDQITSFEDDSIIIILELFGGNDGLNTIVPAYNDSYYTLRPELGIPKENARQHQNTDLYFNPNLVDGVHNGGMLQLFEDGRLAVIEGIGYDNPNLSHFRSQDIWLSGYNNSNASVNLNEGWLGRFIASKLPNYPIDIPKHPIAIQLSGTLSLLLKSDKGDMGIALTDPDTFYNLGQGMTPKEKLRTGDTYYDDEFNFAYTIAKQSELYSKAVKDAYDSGKDKIKVQYSDGLAKKFELISQLIAGGLETKVYYVSLSNFDSHAQQMNDVYSGQHPTLLREAANAICEFMDDGLKQGWSQRVVGMTSSEFGRRAYENGSRGTDHGAASMQFVFGHDDYVNGAYFREEGKPDLIDLDEDGNIKYQFDYRRTFVDFLGTWFGATEEELESVFGQKFQPIGVLKPRIVSVREDLAENSYGKLNVYPNPSRGKQTIQFELRIPSTVEVSVYSLLGKKVMNIYSGILQAGIYEYPFLLSSNGAYIANVTVNGKSYTSRFSVLK